VTGAGVLDVADRAAVPAPLQRLFPAELQEQLITLRRTLHQHPELSHHEMETAAIGAK
jgi:metal-dependent amidase/aminoacylase/carboxypeptidase family protein